jgi:hypothetical protein
MLWIRRIDSLMATPLAGTERSLGMVWSPDSRFLAFRASDLQLKKVPIIGGPPVTVVKENYAPGSWGDDGS